MKKVIAILSAVTLMTACGENKTETTTGDSSAMSTPMDTSKKMSEAPKDTMGMTKDTMAMKTDMAKDGMMTMKDGKMMMMKDGKWMAMTETMTCTDGCKVMANGDVMMKDGKKMKMTEGEMIDKDGHMMDKDGKMMDNKMMDKKM